MATVLARQPIHVADQAALLALSPAQLLSGDIFIRDDNDHPYMLIGDDSGVFSSWLDLASSASADLTTETAARIAGDGTLTTNLAAEVTNRTTAVTGEAATRASADTTLQNNINTEITNRTAAVSGEAATRATADTTLQTNITTEITNRTAAVSGEAVARAAADQALSDSIAAISGGLTPVALVSVNGVSAAKTFEPVTTASGAVTRTLPTAPANGTTVGYKLVTQGVGLNLTVATSGSDVFNRAGGSAAYTMSIPNESVQFIYMNGIYFVQYTDLPAKSQRTVSASGGTAVWNEEIRTDTTTGAFVLVLPSPTITKGEITITNIGPNTLTLTGTVSGAINPTLAPWSSRSIRTNGTVLYFV